MVYHDCSYRKANRSTVAIKTLHETWFDSHLQPFARLTTHPFATTSHHNDELYSQHTLLLHLPIHLSFPITHPTPLNPPTMLFSRIVSVFLRFGEFVCAGVVLGLMAHLLRKYDHTHTGPLAREIYTIVVAALSTLFALVWLIPTKRNLLHYPFDLLLSVAWFAAFGM
jgi:hypothetical protein